MSKFALSLIVALVASAPAHAWGKLGHRAIADIAWTQLTAAARRDIEGLLALAPQLATPACPVGSFEDGATWADCVRSQYHDRYALTASWHYVDVSICRPFELPDDRDARFIVARFESELAVLANRRNPPAARLEALLWVEHLAGDLHQPLHVGDAGDRGGNEVPVYPSTGRYPLNLHAEWDRNLVEDAIRATPGGVAGLAAAASTMEPPGGAAATWARESWEIARRDAYRRPRFQARTCEGQRTPVDIDAEYGATAVSVVQRQLERAGVRLAVTLNRSLG